MNNNVADDNFFAYNTDCVWSFKEVIKVFFLYFFLVFVGSPILYQATCFIFGKDFVNNLGENSLIIVFSVLVNLSSCFYIIYLIHYRNRQPLSSLGITLHNWDENVANGIRKYLIAIPFLILSGLVTKYICELFGVSPKQQEIAKKIADEDSLQVLILMIVFGAIIAPVIEELIFRGFLQTTLYKYFGRWKTIVIGSFLFSVIHLNPYVIFQIFILGLFLSYAFDKTRSLVTSITIHTIHNSITFALLLYFKKVF